MIFTRHNCHFFTPYFRSKKEETDSHKNTLPYRKQEGYKKGARLFPVTKV